MAGFEQERLLESIATLTAMRDRESLELCLTQTMFQLLSIEEITLHHVTGDQLFLLVRVNQHGYWSANDMDNDIDELQSIAHNHLFTECLHLRQVQMELDSGGQYHYAFPVFHLRRNLGILYLISRVDLSKDNRLISGFLRIYQNYLALIYENNHDKLTGLLNRKTFDERFLSIMLKIGQDTPDRVCTLWHFWLAVLDIDHFKRINDNFGHLYGDEVLLLLANIMRESFNRGDLLFRYGGEEFIILLKAGAVDDVWALLEQFRQAVENYHFPQVGRVTVSCGFTQIVRAAIPTVLLEHADQALYYAKGHGRNRVCYYEELTESGLLAPAQSQSSGDVELF